MPSWGTHCLVAEMFGIERHVCDTINLIIDSEGNNETQWESVENYVRAIYRHEDVYEGEIFESSARVIASGEGGYVH